MVSKALNTAYSTGGGANGLWRAIVQEVNGSLLSVTIPRLGQNNLYENVPFIGFTPQVGDRIWVGFIEGRSFEPVAFVGASDTSTDITEIVAGTNLNGGGSGGSITVNLDDDITLSTVTADEFYGDLHGAIHLQVKNVDSVALSHGDPVYATGAVGASGAIEVQGSSAGSAGTMPAMGLLDQDLAVNGEGDVVVSGVLQNFDTDTPGYSVGDELYVAPSGGLTTTRPTGSSELVQKIGKVIRVQQNTGEILVQGAGRTNDVPNSISITGDMTVGGDATVTGDLTVNGATVTLNTETLTVEDNIIVLNSNVSGTPTLDAGIEVERGTSANVSFLWDESADEWAIGPVNVSGDIKLTGEIDGPSDFTVSNGQGEAIEFNQTNNATYLKTTGVNRLTIDSIGNVTIGSSTQYVEVDYDSNSKLELVDDNATGRPYLAIFNQDSSGTLTRKAYFGFPSAASDASLVDLRSDTGALRFLSGDGEAVRILENKRVGIGTISPRSELHIEGTSTPEISITSTDATDTALYFGDSVDNVRGGVVYDLSANALQLRGYNNSTRLTVESNGNIDIPQNLIVAKNAEVNSLNVLNDTQMTGTLSVQSEVSAPRIRLSSTTDASLTSTAHAFQIGPDSGDNIRIDGNEILSLNNGAVKDLHLQVNGGRVTVGNSTAGTLYVNNQIDINSLHLTQNDADGCLRVQGNTGYIDLGPKNATYCHIYTDRGSFYFNKTSLYANSTSNKIWHRGDMRGATASVSMNSAGYGSLLHGLGTTPDFAFIGARTELSNGNDNQLAFPIVSATSTTLNFRAYEIDTSGNGSAYVSTIYNATVYVYYFVGNQ